MASKHILHRAAGGCSQFFRGVSNFAFAEGQLARAVKAPRGAAKSAFTRSHERDFHFDGRKACVGAGGGTSSAHHCIVQQRRDQAAVCGFDPVHVVMEGVDFTDGNTVLTPVIFDVDVVDEGRWRH